MTFFSGLLVLGQCSPSVLNDHWSNFFSTLFKFLITAKQVQRTLHLKGKGKNLSVFPPSVTVQSQLCISGLWDPTTGVWITGHKVQTRAAPSSRPDQGQFNLHREPGSRFSTKQTPHFQHLNVRPRTDTMLVSYVSFHSTSALFYFLL